MRCTRLWIWHFFSTCLAVKNITSDFQIPNLLMMLIEATMKMVWTSQLFWRFATSTLYSTHRQWKGGSPLNIPNSYRYSHLAKFKWCFQTIQLAHKFQQHFDLRSLNSPRHISRCIFPAFCTRQHSIKNSSTTVKGILIWRKIHPKTNFLAF